MSDEKKINPYNAGVFKRSEIFPDGIPPHYYDPKSDAGIAAKKKLQNKKLKRFLIRIILFIVIVVLIGIFCL